MHKRLVGVAASAVMIVAACGGATTSSAPSTGASVAPASPTPAPSVATTEDELFGTAYAPEAGVDGGTIIIGDWQEATQFNPFYVGQVTENNVQSAVTASLITTTYDYKFQADLATEIPTIGNGGVVVPGANGDAMTVTWTLRDGLKWSDGEALTCDDFRYAWEWVLDPANAGVITQPYSVIKDWECVSDTEMVLHYTEINSSYITVATAPLPRHDLESIPVAEQVTGKGFQTDQLPSLPVSGPFKYESVTTGLRAAPRQEPELRVLVDRQAGLPGLAHLEVVRRCGRDDRGLPRQRDRLRDRPPGLRPHQGRGPRHPGQRHPGVPVRVPQPELVRYRGRRHRHRWLLAQPGRLGRVRGEGCPMADPVMREAVTYAVNKDEINTRLLGGSVEIANTNISPNAWFYADQPPATYDPAKAIEILEAGGWTDSDGDGVREKDGLKAIIELCTTTRQVRQDTLALIADYLKEVGIQGIPNAGLAGRHLRRLQRRPPGHRVCPRAVELRPGRVRLLCRSLDPLGNYYTYHSSQFEPDGQNDARVKNAELDAALDTVKTTVDFDVIKDGDGDVPEDLRGQDRRVPALLPQERRPRRARPSGTSSPTRLQAGPTWNAADWFIELVPDPVDPAVGRPNDA